MGDWKAVRLHPSEEIQLYDLSKDLAEENNIASEHPEIITKVKDILVNGRTTSEYFPLKGKEKPELPDSQNYDQTIQNP